MPAVYLLTSPSGGQYIGLTNRTVEDRLKEHCKLARSNDKRPLYSAIRKYGIENFLISELVNFPLEDKNLFDLNLIEREFILHFRNSGARLYNLTDGGEGTLGYKPTKETLEKVSEASKLSWEKPEYRNKQTQAAFDRWKDPAFRERQAAGVKILHQNQDYLDKQAENTRKAWAAGVYNNAHSKAKITMRGKNAKLNEDLVREIKARIHKESLKMLSEEYGIHMSTLNNIKRGTHWAWVE